MANFSGKYLKVWKVEEQNGYTKLDLGESQKKYNADGYDNWTWFGCVLFGEAAKKEIKEGDKVEVKSAQIYQEKYNDKWYTRVKIFHIDVMESEESAPEPPADKPAFTGFDNFKKKPDSGSFEGGGAKFEDDIPF